MTFDTFGACFVWFVCGLIWWFGFWVCLLSCVCVDFALVLVVVNCLIDCLLDIYIIV